MFSFAPGATSVSIQFFLRDALTGEPKTGLGPSSPGASVSYTRAGGIAAVIPLVNLASATAAWTAGGWYEIDPTNAPGLYRLDLPNAALAVGVPFLAVSANFSGALGESALILLQSQQTMTGPGAYALNVTVRRSDNNAVLGGVAAWVTTDQAGSNVIAGTLSTSSAGLVTFYLNAGTYYLWLAAQGYTASNPQSFTTVNSSSSVTFTVTPATAASIVPAASTHTARVTAQDLLERLLDYLGANATENAYRQARRAVLDGYREFGTAHKWTYYQTQGRVFMNGEQTVGTVYYQYSSGTYPRQLTLIPDPSLGGTWPAWAALGYVRINMIVAEVDQVISSTVLTLKDPIDYASDVNASTLSAITNPLSNNAGVGNGTVQWTFTTLDGSSNPLANISIEVTSDPAGQNLVAGPLLTNASGQLILFFNPGTYYVFAGGPGYGMTNPTTITVTPIAGSLTLTLTAMSPGAVPPVGVGYTLFQDTYTLPEDYVQGDNTLAEQIWGTMNYIPPAQWLAWIRFRESYGYPMWYTIMGDPKAPGRMCVKVYPYPDHNMTLDFVYQRAPRKILVFNYSAGSASVNPGVSTVTVNFTGATLTSNMVGSVLRLSSSPTEAPTAAEGLNPAIWEATITSVPSSSSCTIDNPCSQTLTNIKYIISDPIDVENTAMLNALYRCAEKHMTINRTMKEQAAMVEQYRQALILAKEADARVQARRSAGVGGTYRPRLAFMPRGPDIS